MFNPALPQIALPIMTCVALVDPVLSACDKWKGTNEVRFFSGILLGVMQMENLRFFRSGCVTLSLIASNGLCCAVFAFALLRAYLKRCKS